MSLEANNQEGTARISLEGECTITRAEELKSTFQEALKQYDRVELDLSGLTSVDLSFLQLLCSAQHSFAAADKNLLAVSSPAQVLAATAAESGFNQACTNCSLVNCALNNSAV